MLIRGILTQIRCGNRLLDLSSPIVMGILNITPDSFFSPSRMSADGQKALEKASEMIAGGARIIDVGGMSTRPGAEEISINEELNRIIPVIENIHEAYPDTIISVDTYRGEVAQKAIEAGASMINDISGGNLDESILKVAANHPVPYILMHMRGKPSDMQKFTDYQDVVSDVLKYFVGKLRQLHDLGLRDIIIDPGFGFSKTMEQNYQIVNHLNVFRSLGHPLMIGLSRKSTLSMTIGKEAESTLDATTALHSISLMKGVSILRVHDVRPAMDAIAVYNKLQEAKKH